jgi:uroporphyrin-III C-methyltransferase
MLIDSQDYRRALSLPEFEAGWVWLTGAGPGDPGLVTLHALNGLQQADAIVYDALVNDDILSLAAPDALFEYAGKRGGKPSFEQRDISNRLVQLARQGRKVLRLKGGDPFVFGRGGEEALALVRNDIPFRVIPGVTAGIGGLGYAGIPVTHRDVNQAVTFVTGHTADDNGGQLDWAAIAKGSPVIVLYMTLKNIGDIASRLIDGGRSAHEPAAIVSNASMPDQTTVELTLGDLAANPEDYQDLKPAIVVVGEVVRLRQGLDWLGATNEGRTLDPDPLGAFAQYLSGT